MSPLPPFHSCFTPPLTTSSLLSPPCFLISLFSLICVPCHFCSTLPPSLPPSPLPPLPSPLPLLSLFSLPPSLQEMTSLLEENSSLQQKLHSQEEDFNLQNRTLMEEISRVCKKCALYMYVMCVSNAHYAHSATCAVYKCTYMYMYVYLHAANYLYMCIFHCINKYRSCIINRAYIQVRVHVHIHIHVYTGTCTHTCTCTCTCLLPCLDLICLHVHVSGSEE